MAARCASVGPWFGPWANAGAIMKVITAIDAHIVARLDVSLMSINPLRCRRKPPLQPK
jgi:hypothetical protein